MCLSKKARFKPCKVGYKVMRMDSEGNLSGEYYTAGSPRPLGKWLNEEDFREDWTKGRKVIVADSSASYPLGWHIFCRVEDALFNVLHQGLRGLVCVKVSVKDPVAVGYQIGKRITIAKQIKILRIVE